MKVMLKLYYNLLKENMLNDAPFLAGHSTNLSAFRL